MVSGIKRDRWAGVRAEPVSMATWLRSRGKSHFIDTGSFFQFSSSTFSPFGYQIPRAFLLPKWIYTASDCLSLFSQLLFSYFLTSPYASLFPLPLSLTLTMPFFQFSSAFASWGFSTSFLYNFRTQTILQVFTTSNYVFATTIRPVSRPVDY